MELVPELVLTFLPVGKINGVSAYVYVLAEGDKDPSTTAAWIHLHSRMGLCRWILPKFSGQGSTMPCTRGSNQREPAIAPKMRMELIPKLVLTFLPVGKIYEEWIFGGKIQRSINTVWIHPHSCVCVDGSVYSDLAQDEQGSS